MRFFCSIPFLLLLFAVHGEARVSSGQPFRKDAERYLQDASNSTNSTRADSMSDNVDEGPELCFEWITGGDAETGDLSDWDVEGSGAIEFSTDGPFGSTRSYKITNRTSVNSGPGQDLDIGCFEMGIQYKISAKIKIFDESTEDITCDQYAEWLDPNFCPLFTIWAQTPNGVAKLNLGNDIMTEEEWAAGEWNSYNAVFTVDERLSKAGDAHIFIRGPRPDINI